MQATPSDPWHFQANGGNQPQPSKQIQKEGKGGGQIHRDGKEISGCQGTRGGRDGERLLNGGELSFWGMNTLWSKTEAVVAQHFEWSKYHWIAHFLVVKMITFMLCGFYQLNI